MNNGTWNKDLSCCWLSIESLPANVIRLTMVDGNCCDMEGAIRFAKGLMPEVVRIVTISGDKPDTQYFLDGSGNWQAEFAPRKPLPRA